MLCYVSCRCVGSYQNDKHLSIQAAKHQDISTFKHMSNYLLMPLGKVSMKYYETYYMVEDLYIDYRIIQFISIIHYHIFQILPQSSLI